MAVTALSDAELLTGARNGDSAAFTELYVRHQAAAQRLAQGYKRLGDPDDLVNGAFERVLSALRRGSGPTQSFRAYLFVTLRRLAMEQGKHANDEPLDELPEPVMAVAGDRDLDGAERQIIATAFESLPGPWQAVLWQTAVEGKNPRDFAGAIGMTPNAAAALAYRARERLRQAYLQAHLQHPGRDGCSPHRERLGGYVRAALSRRQYNATRKHVAHCSSCAQLVEELSDVNRMLVRSVAPLFLLVSGGAAGLPLGGAGGAAGGAAASAALGPSGLASGAVDGARRVTAAVGAVATAAVMAIALTMTVIPHDGGPAGDRPDVEVQTGADNLAGPRDGGGATVGPSSTTSAPPPGTTGSAPPASTAPPATAPPTSGEEAPGLDVGVDADVDLGAADLDAGLDVDVGEDGVRARADLDLDLHLEWVPGLPGTGTLEVVVPNQGDAAATGLTLDVELAGTAELTAVLAPECTTTPTGLINGVLNLLRSVTCGLNEVASGTTATATFPLLVSVDTEVTVTLSHNGNVVTHETIHLQ